MKPSDLLNFLDFKPKIVLKMLLFSVLFEYFGAISKRNCIFCCVDCPRSLLSLNKIVYLKGVFTRSIVSLVSMHITLVSYSFSCISHSFPFVSHSFSFVSTRFTVVYPFRASVNCCCNSTYFLILF